MRFIALNFDFLVRDERYDRHDRIAQYDAQKNRRKSGDEPIRDIIREPAAARRRRKQLVYTIFKNGNSL